MPNTDEQTCNTCKIPKPWSEYHKDSTRSTGYRVMCKPCVKAYNAARYQAKSGELREWRKGYYAANREKILAKQREYVAENYDEIRAKAKVRREQNPEAARWAGILHRWKITKEQWEAMWVAQGERCGACPSTDMTNLHVDHDHSCCPARRSCGNCIRGIVCSSCNLLLGHAGDSTERLASAMRYLTKYEARIWYRRVV